MYNAKLNMNPLIVLADRCVLSNANDQTVHAPVAYFSHFTNFSKLFPVDWLHSKNFLNLQI